MQELPHQPLPQDEQDLIVSQIVEASRHARVHWHWNDEHTLLQANVGNALLTLHRGSPLSLTVATPGSPSPHIILTATGTGDIHTLRTLAITIATMRRSDTLSFALEASPNTPPDLPEEDLPRYLAENMVLATLAGTLAWYRIDTEGVTAYTTTTGSTTGTLTIDHDPGLATPHRATLTVSGPRGPLALIQERTSPDSAHRTPLGELVQALAQKHTTAADAAAAKAGLNRPMSETTCRILSSLAWPAPETRHRPPNDSPPLTATNQAPQNKST